MCKAGRFFPKQKNAFRLGAYAASEQSQETFRERGHREEDRRINLHLLQKTGHTASITMTFSGTKLGLPSTRPHVAGNSHPAAILDVLICPDLGDQLATGAQCSRTHVAAAVYLQMNRINFSAKHRWKLHKLLVEMAHKSALHLKT